MAASSRISQRRFLIRNQSFDKSLDILAWHFHLGYLLVSQWTSWGVVQNEHKRLVHRPPVCIQKEGLFATTPSSFKHALKRRSSWQACAAAIPPNEWPNAPTRLRSRCPAKGRTDPLVKFARVNSSRTNRMSLACHSSWFRLASPSTDGVTGQRLSEYPICLPSGKMVTIASYGCEIAATT